MNRNQMPAITFAIALSFFASIYAINALEAWSSVGQWIREYQAIISSMALLLTALIVGAFVWLPIWDARRQNEPSLREAADHLRRMNDIKDACGVLYALILVGVADEPGAVENPATYFGALQRCDTELQEFRRLTTEIRQSPVKPSELQFIQACDNFLDMARQIAPGGHVDFVRPDPKRRLQFDLQLNQRHDSLIEAYQITTERLREEIRGMVALLFDMSSKISTQTQPHSSPEFPQITDNHRKRSRPRFE